MKRNEINYRICKTMQYLCVTWWANVAYDVSSKRTEHEEPTSIQPALTLSIYNKGKYNVRHSTNGWAKSQVKHLKENTKQKNIQKKMTLLRPPNWILLFFKILFWTQSLTVNLNFKNEILTNIEFDSFVYIHCIPPLKEKMIIEQRDEHLLHVGIS